jgi:glycerophosphoryl diester phosphodiesterase
VTQVWAHRGASRDAPENTLAAFELAIEQGADGVELDVQLSADGALVVIHDETLDRTTDATGKVSDHSLAELRRVDASAGREGFRGVGLPTLSEALELLAPAGLVVNIELKNSVEPYPGLEQKVLAALDAFDLQRVVLSSFNHYSVRRLSALGARAELAAIYSDPLFRPWRYARDLGVSAIHPPMPYVFGKRFVTRAREEGISVRPWVVNSPGALLRMFRYGVDALFTDAPDVALALRTGA